MAHYNKIIANSGGNHVTKSSRYANSKVLHYTENKILTFETYKGKRSKFIPNAEQWMEITMPYEYRPDLISHEIYGSPDFWWRLLEANGMKDIMEFKNGVNIRLPGDIF